MEYTFSIIIPFYNEEHNVKPLIRKIIKYMPKGITFEIIAVDDHSHDNTYNDLQALQSQISVLNVFVHDTNLGQSAAQLTGVLQAQYPWIITLDGDGQNNPKDLPLFIRCLQEINPAQNQRLLINGNRILSRKDGRLRKIGSRLFQKLRYVLLTDTCPDSGCCFRLFDRVTFLEIPHFKNFHCFLPALYQDKGAYVKNITISHEVRKYGISHYSIPSLFAVAFFDTFKVMWLLKHLNRQK